LQEELRTQIELQWNDNVKARILNRDQGNQYRKKNDEPALRSQHEFYNYLKEKSGK
jgi:polyphosphate kinase